jgi:WD40 repeat protein
VPGGGPDRPGWQVRISPAVPGRDGGLAEADVPSGGGVWVGDRWVLTCAHVIGSEPRTVIVRFSFTGGEPITATVAPTGWLAGEQGDLALLELERDPPQSARPAPLRLAHTVTGHACAAYGYPAGHDNGVWSESAVTGQTVDRLQLTARDDLGHQIEKGFSGTGLFDIETGAVVGLVVTRDRGTGVRGGFAIPLQAVVAAFPQLGPWVGWRLGTDRFLRQHWWPRARGVYEDTTPGWYFTGRTALLRELTGWLEHGAPDRAVRVVTGPAGTGKSAMLAWVCALSDPQLRTEVAASGPAALADAAAVPAVGRVSAAVWARGLDAERAAGALAAALTLSVTPGAAAEDVLAAVGDLDPADRAALVVVVDALDEAQPRAAREIARRLLVPLVRDLGVKVLAGTRPGRHGELLAALGERAVVYRLDDAAWFEPLDLADYAAACLRADFDPALPSGYRTDPHACQQVAAAIADAAGTNFLVAGLAARARADEPVIDVGTPSWRDGQRFPAEVGQAFDDYLARFGEKETLARDLLRAAAYAEGAGLAADAQWADIASALAAPHRYGSDDLAWLLSSAAAYLIESSDEYSQPTFRLFHQALIEHLRPQDKERRAQRTIASTLIAAVPRTAGVADWAQATPYILRHLAAHAAPGGVLDGLLEDPGFLVAADPSGLLPVLDSAISPQARRVAWFYRITADRLRTNDLAERAAHLQLAAGKAGLRQIADALAATAMSWLWNTSVLSWRPPGRYTALGSTRRDGIQALTVTPRGDVLAVVGGNDGTVALWRGGEDGLVPVGDPQPGHSRGVRALAVGQLGGQSVAVTGGYDGMVALWRLGEDGLALIGDPQRVPGRNFPVEALAVGLLGDESLAVIGGYDGMVALWRGGWDGLVLTGDPQPVPQPLGGDDEDEIADLSLLDLEDIVDLSQLDEDEPPPVREPQPVSDPHRRDGQLLAISRTGADGLARVGDPQTGRFGIVAVAIGQLGGQSVAVTGGDGGMVALWRLGEDGLALIGDPQRIPDHHSSTVPTVAIGQLGGQSVAVTGGGGGMVALWRLGEDGLARIGGPQPGHRGPLGVRAAAVCQLSGQSVAVTGGDGGTLAVWRLGENGLALLGDPQHGHDGRYVRALAVGQLGGQTVAVTIQVGGMVALWRLGEDGLAPVGDPQPGHGGRFEGLTVAVGKSVAVTGGTDNGTVALWRLGEGGLARIGEPQPGHWPIHEVRALAVAVGQLGGQSVAVTGGEDGTLALWRLGEDRLARIGDPQHVHFRVGAVAVGQLGGRSVAVTGGYDGTVALWRLGEDGLAPVGNPQHGHARTSIRAVAVGQLGGQSVAVTGA